MIEAACGHDYVLLTCQTSQEEFARITAVISQGQRQQRCDFEEVSCQDGKILYRVHLRHLADEKLAFYVLYEDGTRQRVWKPGPGFSRKDLPDSLYFTIFLNLAYSNDPEQQVLRTKQRIFSPVLRSITCAGHDISLQGLLFLSADNDFPADSQCVVLGFRNEDIRFSAPLTLEPVEGEVLPGRPASAFLEFNECRVYRFSSVLSFAEIGQQPGSFNFFLSHGGILQPLRQISRKPLRKNLFGVHRLGLFQRALIIPYYDVNYHRWRMDVHHVSLFAWFRLRLLYRRALTTPPKRNPYIWLVGEYTTSARDNGMHFYNYMRKHHPEVKVYYILERGADRSALTDQRNVIAYGSYRHFAMSRRAGTLIFSHLPEYLVPKVDYFSGYSSKNFSDWFTFFLQHGVIAGRRKNIDNLYGTHVRTFDCFFVSSEREENIITSSLGYKKEDVRITGLARWDGLKDESSTHRRMILFVPTWRKSLENIESTCFKESSFFQHWNALLSNNVLHEFSRKENIHIVFILHTAFKRFLSCFDENDTLTFSTMQNVQSLLCRCNMMVTDYSSIAFDVLYQKKPVVYFQFDRYSGEFDFSGQSFDFETELPGPAHVSADGTVESIIRYVQNDFLIEPIYDKRRTKFFAYQDHKNCARIYRHVKEKIQERIS